MDWGIRGWPPYDAQRHAQIKASLEGGIPMQVLDGGNSRKERRHFSLTGRRVVFSLGGRLASELRSMEFLVLCSRSRGPSQHETDDAVDATFDSVTNADIMMSRSRHSGLAFHACRATPVRPRSTPRGFRCTAHPPLCTIRPPNHPPNHHSLIFPLTPRGCRWRTIRTRARRIRL